MNKDVTSKNLLIRGDSLKALERLTDGTERPKNEMAPHETENPSNPTPATQPDAPAALPQIRGQVKMIYIDPPYNTGNRFAYRDARAKDEWATMMRPRLTLAREALREDGLIFISIDINEFAALKALCDAVFGAGNFVANFVWVSNLKGRQLGAGPAGTHEYILCYARDAARVGKLRGNVERLRRLMPKVYHLPKRPVKHDARGAYVTKNELYNTNSKFNEVTSPSMVYAIHYHRRSGEVAVSDVGEPAPGGARQGWVTALPHPNAKPGLRWHAWRWSRERVLADRDDLEFEVVKERLPKRQTAAAAKGAVVAATAAVDETAETAETPRKQPRPRLRLVIRTKIRDFDTTTLKDLIMGPNTRTGQRELERLGLGGIFETPKPVELLRVLVEAASAPGDLVMDFFAGSGAFGVAAARAGCRFILVQLEEPFSPRHEARAGDLGFTSIADLTAERLRRDGVPFHELRLC